MNNKDFNETIMASSAIKNAPKNKIFLFSLKKDSIVSINNTVNYVNEYGRSRVQSYFFDNNLHKVCTPNKYEIFNVDHSGGQLLANLFSLSFIKNVSVIMDLN